MTDNEIIEGLKLCTNEEEKYCKGCPFIDEMNCVNSLTKHALDLIKRKDEQIEALIAGQETLQKALNEKIAKIENYERYMGNLARKNREPLHSLKRTKFEAVKEFAERLKLELPIKPMNYSGIGSLYDAECIHSKIDRIKKEMVGKS